MPTVVAQYPVQDGQPVLVDVLIGDQQPGGTNVFLGSDNLKTVEGDLVDFLVGQGEALRGKALVISSVVVDRNPMTDFVSTVVSLDGGSHPHVDIPQSENVGPSGVANFLTVVNFV
jgi:hypothetical protein